MTPTAELTPDELRERVRTLCHLFATRHYRAANPGATADEADRYAARSWRTFRPAAIAFLALALADREAGAAAPLN